MFFKVTFMDGVSCTLMHAIQAIIWYLFSLFNACYANHNTVLFFSLFRFIESHWFVWVTQMSHIPMKVDTDKKDDWFTSQLNSTCNVDQGIFNDWFTGHLNFQIEHQ